MSIVDVGELGYPPLALDSNRANSNRRRRSARVDETEIGESFDSGWVLKVHPDFHPALDAINADDIGDDNLFGGGAVRRQTI